ncbi:S49 family peptidase [Salinarchaeum chitinilyticum]
MPTWGQILEEISSLQKQGVDSPFDRVRRFYLSELNDYTGRDTILYSTAWTQPGGDSSVSINDRDVHAFMEVVHGLDTDKLDIIIHSPGGSAESAEQIVGYLRKKFNDVRIFVPQAAMSAATLMCCAADKVFMGRHSAIGPIDPQFVVQTPFGHRMTAAQAIVDQFSMAQESINNHTDLIAWQPLLNQYSVGLLAECNEAMGLSRDLAREWAEEYMHSDKSANEAERLADEISSFLSDRQKFKSHGRRIDRDLAAANGLDVESLESDQELQDAVLSVFHATMHTHAGRPVMKLIENHQGRAVIKRTEGTMSAARPSSPVDGGDDGESDDGQDGDGESDTETEED